MGLPQKGQADADDAVDAGKQRLLEVAVGGVGHAEESFAESHGLVVFGAGCRSGTGPGGLFAVLCMCRGIRAKIGFFREMVRRFV